MFQIDATYDGSPARLGHVRISSQSFATEAEASALVASFPKSIRAHTVHVVGEQPYYLVRFSLSFTANKATGGANETSARRYMSIRSAFERAGHSVTLAPVVFSNAYKSIAEIETAIERIIK